MEGAVRLLVTRFIPLTPKDLEKWEMDVEEWMNQEENEDEQWEYELRVCVLSPCLKFASDCSMQPCAERVLLSLSLQYGRTVSPILRASFDSVAGV